MVASVDNTLLQQISLMNNGVPDRIEETPDVFTLDRSGPPS
jgi:hypothetical protein